MNRFLSRLRAKISPKKRRVIVRRLVLMLVIVILISIWINTICVNAAPIVLVSGEKVARSKLEKTVNDAVKAVIDRQHYTYGSFARKESTADGVSGVEVNTAGVSGFKTEVLNEIYDSVGEMSILRIKIPTGTILAPKYFSGRGFNAVIRAVMYTAVTAKVTSRLESTGINQTLHTISVTIYSDVSLLCMTQCNDFTLECDIIVAQSVIVGNIPSSYVDF